MELEWSEDQCLELIGAYEGQPILWKPSYPNHFSENKKKDAWQAISKEIGIEEDNVRQKMTSLLSSFCQQKAKGKRSIGTRKGTSKKTVGLLQRIVVHSVFKEYIIHNLYLIIQIIVTFQQGRTCIDQNGSHSNECISCWIRTNPGEP